MEMCPSQTEKIALVQHRRITISYATSVDTKSNLTGRLTIRKLKILGSNSTVVEDNDIHIFVHFAF